MEETDQNTGFLYDFVDIEAIADSPPEFGRWTPVYDFPTRRCILCYRETVDDKCSHHPGAQTLFGVRRYRGSFAAVKRAIDRELPFYNERLNKLLEAIGSADETLHPIDEDGNPLPTINHRGYDVAYPIRRTRRSNRGDKS